MSDILHHVHMSKEISPLMFHSLVGRPTYHNSSVIINIFLYSVRFLSVCLLLLCILIYVCVYIYVYIYVYIHTYIHIYIYICMYI